MRRLIVLLASLTISCQPGEPAPEAAPSEEVALPWDASIELVDGSGMLQLRLAGEEVFQTWRVEQPLPIGATVRTPATARTAISVNGVEAVLDQSSTIELRSPTSLAVQAGRLLLTNPTAAQFELQLPQGAVAVSRGKVVVAATTAESILTVTRGGIAANGAQAYAGDQLTWRGDTTRVAPAPDLGAAVSWAAFPENTDLPEVERGLGKLVGKTPGVADGPEFALRLVRHTVDVTIRGNLAYTEITESFHNPLGRTLEGLYRFPLPPDARITRLSLKVGDTWMEGEFLETARAERIWQDVIAQWRDPALLKWKEGNMFELRIFPIDPNQTRVVKIGYVQRLTPTASGYSYTYPMPVDRAGLIPAEKFEVNGTLYGHDASQPLQLLGYPGEIETGATEGDEAVARFRVSEDDFVARGDLGLQFRRRETSGLRTYSFADRAGEQQSLFVIRPELPTTSATQPRDFVIVLDRSYNRNGAALRVQQKLIPRMIEEMDPRDRVMVLACHHSCTPVGPTELHAAGAETAHDVALALLDLTATGGTYPVEAVRVATEMFREREGAARDAHIIYLTDGVASVGELRPGAAADAVRTTLAPFSARLSVVDLGSDSDALMLEALARAGDGRVVTIDTMLSTTGQALQVLSAHYRTVLSRPQVTLPAGFELVDRMPPSLSAGDELVIAARTRGAQSGELILTGEILGEPVRFAYPFALSADARNTFVPGEWAAQKIASLELDPAHSAREIIQLSTKYGVLSRYTTLLALESKEMMREFNVKAHDRTAWRGEETSTEVEEPAPRRTTAKPKPQRTPSPYDSLSLDFMGGSGRGGGGSAPLADSSGGVENRFPSPARLRSTPTPRPSPRRRPPPRVVVQPSFTPHHAAPTTASERSVAASERERIKRDPTNRTARMKAIRLMIRAEDTSATFYAGEWLRMNRMDPEAVVQRAQLYAVAGDLATFYEWLISASDAAPRGRWLQERIQRAAKSQGDDALRCAMEVALEATQTTPPVAPRDILACPMMTDLRGWRGEAPAITPEPEPTATGAMTVTLTSTGGDWDILVLEPSGRPLWWGSARRDLRVANVRGVEESWALPVKRDGHHSIYAVPHTGRAGDKLTVTVKAGGVTRTFDAVAKRSKPFEIAEIRR